MAKEGGYMIPRPRKIREDSLLYEIGLNCGCEKKGGIVPVSARQIDS